MAQLPRSLRSLTLATTFVGASVFVGPDLASADESPVGVWKTIDDETGEAKSLVKIYEREGVLYGKVQKLFKNPDATCDACEGDDYGKPIVGMTILWGLDKDGDEWNDGKIFDPKKGKTYNCKMWLDDGDLRVRGYVGPFHRTQTWHRVE